jgi:hypothetical protein
LRLAALAEMDSVMLGEEVFRTFDVPACNLAIKLY